MYRLFPDENTKTEYSYLREKKEGIEPGRELLAFFHTIYISQFKRKTVSQQLPQPFQTEAGNSERDSWGFLTYICQFLNRAPTFMV